MKIKTVSNKGMCSVAICCKSCSTYTQMLGFDAETSKRVFNHKTGTPVNFDLEIGEEWKKFIEDGVCPDCQMKEA